MKQIDHNRQKKIAAINDLSGFGRSSLSVEIPIISAMGIQCCPLPTAVFSAHTGFSGYVYADMTDRMADMMHHWKELGLVFDGIAAGYLCSQEQADIVLKFLREFKTEKTTVLIDPVMGDDGRLYPGYGRDMVNEIQKLVPCADILTPNLTEACLLAERPYPLYWDRDYLEQLCDDLHGMGAAGIVITGLEQGDRLINFISDQNRQCSFCAEKRIGGCRAGTGDVFASVLIAALVKGYTLKEGVRLAADYISLTIEKTAALGIPESDGLAIEETLGFLCR